MCQRGILACRTLAAIEGRRNVTRRRELQAWRYDIFFFARGIWYTARRLSVSGRQGTLMLCYMVGVRVNCL